MMEDGDEANEGQIEGFDASTLPDKDKIYFNDYATLMQQQAMLLDHVRTSVYHFAIRGNQTDFEQKVVLDVGAGTGLLSFFAAHAGALRVYSVEASGMARHAQTLAEANNLAGVVHVLHQKVEEVTLDERVDVLVSEPLGIALVNERMLESYLVARDNLLKPGGKMFPDKSSLFLAPFSDAALYAEQQQKSSFWVQKDYYGIDLSHCTRRRRIFTSRSRWWATARPPRLSRRRWTRSLTTTRSPSTSFANLIFRLPLRLTPCSSCTALLSGLTAPSRAASGRGCSPPRQASRSRTGTRRAACCATP